MSVIMEATLDDALRKDLKAAAATLTPNEARFLVDSYYQQQQARIRANNQIMALSETGEPTRVIQMVAKLHAQAEAMINSALDIYSRASELGQWARRQKGIGPVIAAGLLAHIDLDRVTTAGSIWRYAGLDPSSKWESGQRRPWNAQLKTLCWKIGQSFVKQSGHEDAFYGRIYAERKAYEQARNEAGDYAEQAAAAAKRVDKATKAHTYYVSGKLSPGHIQQRSERYATKLFLAHYFEMGWKLAGREVPLPYPIAHGEHVHKIEPPQ